MSLSGDSGQEIVAEPPGQTLDTPIFEVAVRSRRGFRGDGSTTEVLANRKWLCITYQDLTASSVGRQLLGIESEDEALAIISMVFGGKSPNTTNKRANCMRRFIDWSVKHLHVSIVIPFYSTLCNSYLMHLKTIGKHGGIVEFVETLVFSHHVVGIDMDFDIDNNVVMKGILRGAKQSRKKVKQSRPLTAKEILALETALIEQRGNKIDLYAIGVFLFQLYARSRVSDIRNIVGVVVDITDGQGYIEMKTFDHKMKRLAGSLGLSLLLIAPIFGLHSKSSGRAFIETAKNVGFDFTQGHRGPLLPAIGCAGEWLDRAVTSDETTDWLNLTLSRLLGHACKEGLTSHGMKSTILSWMAKSGYPEDVRLILGHHSLKGKKTLESYSRDMQSHPLRCMEECIKPVRDGHFFPDMTRSGYFIKSSAVLGSQPTPPSPGLVAGSAPLPGGRRNGIASHSSQGASDTVLVGDDPEEPHAEEPLDETTSNSSSDTVYESSSESDTNLEKIASSNGLDSLNSNDVWRRNCNVFQNRKTKMLHLQVEGSTSPCLWKSHQR